MLFIVDMILYRLCSLLFIPPTPMAVGAHRIETSVGLEILMSGWNGMGM